MKRRRERGSHDRAEAYRILDEGLICHVGFVGPGGDVVVLPTAYVRDGDRLVLHGARANRMLRALAGGRDVCVTVTLLDGLILARSAFHMSMNYRSVVMFGRATEVEDREERLRLLDLLVEHIVAGPAGGIRPPTDKELGATLVLTLPIDEASVKLRRGGPVDEPGDLDLPVWAGQLPLRTVADAPRPDEHSVAGGRAVPDHIADYTRPGWT